MELAISGRQSVHPSPRSEGILPAGISLGVLTMPGGNRIITAASIILFAGVHSARAESDLDDKLAAALKAAGFTGNVQQTLEKRLGRSIKQETRQPWEAPLVR